MRNCWIHSQIRSIDNFFPSLTFLSKYHKRHVTFKNFRCHPIFLQRNCWLNLFENFTEFYRQLKWNSKKFSNSFVEQFLCKKIKWHRKFWNVAWRLWYFGRKVTNSPSRLPPHNYSMFTHSRYIYVILHGELEVATTLDRLIQLDSIRLSVEYILSNVSNKFNLQFHNTLVVYFYSQPIDTMSAVIESGIHVSLFYLDWTSGKSIDGPR